MHVYKYMSHIRDGKWRQDNWTEHFVHQVFLYFVIHYVHCHKHIFLKDVI